MTRPAMDVVVCTHTPQRHELLGRCLDAIRAQLSDDDRIVLVVDADEAYASELRAEFPDVGVMANTRTPGLSGARNTGVLAGDAPVVVFVDDDAEPRRAWLSTLRERFTDPSVMMVGGAVSARWEGGSAPTWFPDEFGWVVGCDYVGMPGHGEVMRNPIGANMAIGREVFEVAGLFDEEFGRRGRGLAGCEETELAIRAAGQLPGRVVVRDEEAVVDHLVPRDRQRVKHLMRRCFDEGRSKAQLNRLSGPRDALSAEARHAAMTLPRSWWRSMAGGRPTRVSAAQRVLVSVSGLTATAAGFVVGSVAGRTGAGHDG